MTIEPNQPGEFFTKIPPAIKPAFGHQYPSGTAPDPELRGKAMYADLMKATRVANGPYIAERLTTRVGWLEISHSSVHRRFDEIIETPEKFRIRLRSEAAAEATAVELWTAADVFPDLMLRRPEWVEGRWVQPLGAGPLGIALIMDGGETGILTFEEAAKNWTWRTRSQHLWKPCRRATPTDSDRLISIAIKSQSNAGKA